MQKIKHIHSADNYIMNSLHILSLFLSIDTHELCYKIYNTVERIEDFEHDNKVRNKKRTQSDYS